MAQYKIKITPLQYYFFGGEKHDEEFKINYSVESLDYPQQTTILGMLRYALLVHKGWLKGNSIKMDIGDVDGLIGPESFRYGTKENKFGKIKSVSPLYFIHENTDYFFAPLDFSFDLNRDFELSKDGQVYNYKSYGSHIGNCLINQNGVAQSLFDIIGEVSQVGNEKAEKGGTKEDAFYKQKMKKLEDGWSFAVNAEIDLDLDGLNMNIPFGGEKCIFNIHFEKVEKEKPFTVPANYSRIQPFIYCISDCFIDNIDIKNLPFAVTDSVSFRNLKSKTTTKNFYAFKREQNIDNGMVRSSRYQLLKRGSVLYFDSTEERDKLKAALENNSSRTIGFNQFLTNN